MIDALHELKNNIARVEQSHPYLGNDLSSTCDRAISALQDSPFRQYSAEAAEIIKASPQPTRINPLSLAIDKTGDFIIGGLDKMGDGIIFIFRKISRVSG